MEESKCDETTPATTPDTCSNDDEPSTNVNDVSESKPENKPSPPRKKKVHWDGDDKAAKIHTIAGYIPLRAELTPSEHRSMWWEEDDFEVFMFSAHQSSREGREPSKCLGKIFNECVGDHPPKDSKLEAQLDPKTWSKVSPMLEKWCSHESVRGLERWCNNEYTRARDQEQSALIHSVLREQTKFRVAVKTGGMYGEADTEARDKAMRQASVERSRTAKKFALAMARADQEIVVKAASQPKNSPSQQDKGKKEKKEGPSVGVIAGLKSMARRIKSKKSKKKNK